MCKFTDLVCRLERSGSTLLNEEMYEKVTIICDVEVALVGSAVLISLGPY